jgi:inosine-uridine nucleoside N-ribohydrolase
MKRMLSAVLLAALAMGAISPAMAAPRRVLIDQDGSGPGGSNMMSMMALLQSPDVEVLGISIVTGNGWRDDEARHTLRMLERIGRTDVPVALGAVFPLVRTEEETRIGTALVGQVGWLGAWGQKPASIKTTPAGLVEPPKPAVMPGPWDTPPLPEGEPHLQPVAEDAVHFMIRQVHAHPHEVTIYAAGPLTDIALAVAIDPHFAELSSGIVIMGGSLNPHTDDPEFSSSPRHEFNFWFDPEAAHIVLRAHWPRLDLTTVDVSIKAMYTGDMVAAISRSPHPAARYVAEYSEERYYLWDELAACAWLDPSIITRERVVYMDVDVSHGPSYGNTLTWTEEVRPEIAVRQVHAQLDVDLAKFTHQFVALLSAPPVRPPAAARRP